jgi:DNA-binding NarL/FixJ family response regulator
MSLEQAISYALEVIATAPSVVPKAAPTAMPSIDLTPREREVMALVAQGLTNRQIAVEMGIAERTADTHISRILHKLGVSSRLEVAAIARRHGLVGAQTG